MKNILQDDSFENVLDSALGFDMRRHMIQDTFRDGYMFVANDYTKDPIYGLTQRIYFTRDVLESMSIHSFDLEYVSFMDGSNRSILENSNQFVDILSKSGFSDSRRPLTSSHDSYDSQMNAYINNYTFKQ